MYAAVKPWPYYDDSMSLWMIDYWWLLAGLNGAHSWIAVLHHLSRKGDFSYLTC